MLLDDLVKVIETLKERIATHGATLRENETRTRMALIDPLLQALGWDTSEPAVVLPEYDVSISFIASTCARLIMPCSAKAEAQLLPWKPRNWESLWHHTECRCSTTPMRRA